MIDFIPYFAALITLLFGVAISYAVSDGWNFKDREKYYPVISELAQRNLKSSYQRFLIAMNHTK